MIKLAFYGARVPLLERGYFCIDRDRKSRGRDRMLWPRISSSALSRNEQYDGRYIGVSRRETRSTKANYGPGIAGVGWAVRECVRFYFRAGIFLSDGAAKSQYV